MAKKKAGKVTTATIETTTTPKKTTTKKTASTESTSFVDSALSSIGSFLSDPSRKAVVDAVLSSLPLAEGERTISRMPIGKMVQRTVDDFATRTKSIAAGSNGVTHVDSWPEEKKALEKVVEGADFMPAHFLVEGARRQAAVARIRLKKPHKGLPAGAGWGTGFLLSPSLFLTNNHVIPDKGFAKSHLRIQFNFQNDLNGSLLPVEEYEFDGDAFFLTSVETKLDYTLIRIKANDGGVPGTPPILPGNKWGTISLQSDLIPALGQKVNIIQHPDGRPKEVVLHQNEVTEVFANVVHYRADTEPGSSGSPVFNNSWELVALHHAGGKKGPDGKWLSNEGIRIDRIIDDIKANASAIATELGI
jgi:V8-like Glu-specific endopeptidase